MVVTLLCPIETNLIIYSLFTPGWNIADHENNDQEEIDSDEDYMYPMSQPNPNIDTNRIDEIPAKEPNINAVPLKSALKKKGSNPGTPTQDNRALAVRYDTNPPAAATIK